MSASTEFRKELVKIMPGYNWTVHKGSNPQRITATGIQSSGFNRLSTLQVTRIEVAPGAHEYEAKSAGFGGNAPWMHTIKRVTLARALRALQDHYQSTANTYRSLAMRLQEGRTAPPSDAKGV